MIISAYLAKVMDFAFSFEICAFLLDYMSVAFETLVGFVAHEEVNWIAFWTLSLEKFINLIFDLVQLFKGFSVFDAVYYDAGIDRIKVKIRFAGQSVVTLGAGRIDNCHDHFGSLSHKLDVAVCLLGLLSLCRSRISFFPSFNQLRDNRSFANTCRAH